MTASLAPLLLAAAVLLTPAARGRRWVTRRGLRPAWRRTATVAVAVVGLAALTTVVPVGVVVAAVIVAGTVVARRRRSARSSRRAREAAELQSALAVLLGELRVGAHPVAAFDVAAREVKGSVATGMRAVAARARLGADVAAGLIAVSRDSAHPAHWERLSACWHLAQTHGLAIATLMRTAQCDIVARERFTSRVSAGMAGARATAVVLAGLPLLGIGLGQLIGADPVRFLVSDGVGGWLLAAGTTLACVGLLWSDRIVNRILT